MTAAGSDSQEEPDVLRGGPRGDQPRPLPPQGGGGALPRGQGGGTLPCGQPPQATQC